MTQQLETKKIQGGHILARAMARKGIKRIFSLSGGFLNPFFDGCLECGIEVVGTRNEQEAGFMANMCARLSREVSVVVAEPSGFTNYISGVAEAYYSGDPVIYISAASNFHALDKMGFKEMPQHRVVECMTKYSKLVTEGTRIPEFFNKAYEIACTPPTGPVELSIPVNWLFSSYDTSEKENERPLNLDERFHCSPRPQERDLDFVAAALKEAVKPVIIAGSGIIQSRGDNELEEFCSSLHIPFFHSNHLEIRTNNFTHPFYMGLADIHQNPASRLIYAESDLAILIGCRMDYTLDFGNPPLFNKKTKMISVNPSARELSDNQAADFGILSDPKEFLVALRSRTGRYHADAAWAEQIRTRRVEMNEEWETVAKSEEIPIHPLRACVDVLESLGKEDYLVVDGGDAHGWQETALNITSMRGHDLKAVTMSGPFAQLGVGVSFATAIKMMRKEKRVVLIAGDGAFGLAPGLPMETALCHKLPIVVVVLNNKAWGMIKNQQKAMWNRTCETDLRDIPFHKLIEAMGGHGELVEKPGDLKPALDRCFKSGLPSLINVKTKDVISLITVGLVDRREKSSIE